MAVELTREQARRIAVRAQLLDPGRTLRVAAGLRPAAPQGSDIRLPEELAGEAGQRLEGPAAILDVVRHLAFLQYDLTRAVAPSQHVVLWSRLGASYDPADLQDLLDAQELVELHMVIRPAADIALFTAEMAAWPTPGTWEQRIADWATANADCRRDILDRLRGDGPLPTTELPDTTSVPWQSSGWTQLPVEHQPLPVLHGDRLIGKVDAVAERDEGELIVRAIHEDDPWTSGQRTAIADELASLAEWLGLALVLP